MHPWQLQLLGIPSNAVLLVWILTFTPAVTVTNELTVFKGSTSHFPCHLFACLWLHAKLLRQSFLSSGWPISLAT
jgi:hypothetical protein